MAIIQEVGFFRKHVNHLWTAEAGKMGKRKNQRDFDKNQICDYWVNWVKVST